MTTRRAASDSDQDQSDAPQSARSKSAAYSAKLDAAERDARETEKSLLLAQVLREEANEIAHQHDDAALPDAPLADIVEAIHARRHSALCLSGGGIRSATFNLGVLQALARADHLKHFKYLSTVSGGGYIGGWLSSWIARSDFASVRQCLATGRTPEETGPLAKTDNEPEPIHHLRSFSRYLSPRVGIFSADTWALAAAYIRNLLLTWLVLLPGMAAIVVAPFLVNSILQAIRSHADENLWVLGVIAAAGLLLATASVRYVHRHRPDNADDKPEARTKPGPDQTQFLQRCLAPLVAAGIALTTAWVWITQISPARIDSLFRSVPAWIPMVRPALGTVADHPWAFWGPMVFFGALAHLAGWLLSQLGRSKLHWRSFVEAIAVIVTGGVCGFALGWIAWQVSPWPAGPQNTTLYAVLALPTFAALILFAGDLHLGIISGAARRAGDAEREWGARFNGWVLIVSLGWLVFSSLTLLVPALLHSLRANWTGWSFATFVTGAIGARLGNSGKTGSTSGSTGTGVAKTLNALPAKVVLALSTTAFCLLLVVLLARVDAWLIGLAGCALGAGPTCAALSSDAAFAAILESGSIGSVLAVGFAGAVISLLGGTLIDMNKFSLHGLYRIRLIRAYLGASRNRADRHPDPFIGFDSSDNIRMRDLRTADGSKDAKSPCDERLNQRSRGPRPLHIVNMALNLVRGTQLAWQDRKAESFTVSALHAGSFRLGYRRTSPCPEQRALEKTLIEPGHRPMNRWTKRRHRPKYYGGECGISLGTAMAISGAAASPNSGYHSSATVTFLMTLFNARLGWWLGNPGPRGDAVFDRSAPRLSLLTLWRELFGQTDDTASYVYLSDGGHFDNLGLYEMVLRRCRFIVVSDASADNDCNFADLGSAIRNIRADFQVPIEFDQGTFKIRKRSADGSTVEGAYWALGKIRYSVVDAAADLSPEEAADRYDGLILYVKPCFYGTEPRDVYNYAIESQTFPHEATSDQFFGASQFESYRALGEHIGNLACGDAHLKSFFDQLAAPVTPLPGGPGVPGVAVPDRR